MPHSLKINRFIWLAALLIWVSAASEANPYQSDDQIIIAINAIRVSHGLHSLSDDPAASSAAKEHADELARRHTLSHWGLDGSRVAERYRSAGGTGLSAGENLGAGDSIHVIIDAWMNSPSHRDNLLNKDWNALGIGSSQLEGGRIVLVAVFTTSSWQTLSVNGTPESLRLTGRYRSVGNCQPGDVILVVDGLANRAQILSDSGEDTWLLRFDVPAPQGWLDGRWVPAELTCFNNGSAVRLDLLLIPPP
jgi:hypothetical protein